MSKSQNQLFDLPEADLAHILRHAGPDLEELRGQRLFITGGTGFFGKWLLASLHHADMELGLGLKITVLSRNPTAFLQKHPQLERTGFQFLHGHVAELEAQTTSRSKSPIGADYIIHAATNTTAFASDAEEGERTRTIVEGTRRVLDIALATRARLLNISSGAVYGSFAAKSTGAKEYNFQSARAVTSYGKAKHKAEGSCSTSKVDFSTARAFAFLGPHLPLDAHFAAGNFLRDAIRGGPVVVRGDGTALRSYLHPADLVVWLLRILIRGQRGRAYNVGSDESVTTAQLAHHIADAIEPKPEVIIQSVQPQGPQNIYLPNIDRARTELNLDVFIPLQDAIKRTLMYLKSPTS